jgi:hypothetical protein
MALVCVLVDDITGYRIIINYMIGAVIIPEMILHRVVGMRDRDVVIGGISGNICCPEQILQVHHVINNNRILPYVRIPIP